MIIKFQQLPLVIQAVYGDAKKVDFVRVVEKETAGEVYYVTCQGETDKWKYVNGSWKREG